MNRPTGVTVISILMFIGTGMLTLLAIGAFVGGAFIGALIGGAAAQQQGAGAAGAGIGAMIGGAIGIFCLVGAVLYLFCGIGLWKLKEWGRMLSIVLCAIGAAFGVFGLLGSMIHLHILMMMWRMFWLAVDVGIIWYLSQPHIKAAFNTVPPQQAFAAPR